jgi:hypothetical protein
VAAARAAVRLARSRYDRARAAIYRFYRTTGLVIPVEVYTTKLAELSQLERAYEDALRGRSSNETPPSTTNPAAEGAVPEERRSAAAPGQQVREREVRLARRLATQREAAALQAKITGLRQELADLRPMVLRYRDLDARVTGSLGLLNAAEKGLLDASGLAAASSSPLTFGKPVVTPISRPQVIARSVGVSMGLALVLALGLLAVLELLWPSIGAGRHARTNGQPSRGFPRGESQPVGAGRTGVSNEHDASPWSWF